MGIVGLAGDRGHGLDVLGRTRLLEPQRVAGLQPARHADRAARRELAVRAEQQVRPVAHRRAQRLHEALRAVELGERGLPAVVDGVRTGGVELQRGEALLDVVQGALHRRVDVVVDRRILIGTGIDVGVGAQPLVHAPAEQRVHGLAHRLADDVPAGHLQARQHAHERHVRAQRVAAPVDRVPEPLDVVRVRAVEVHREHVVDHGAHDLGPEGRRVDLAEALDAAGRAQPQEDEVAATEVRRRIADDPDVEVLQHERRGAANVRGPGHAHENGLIVRSSGKSEKSRSRVMSASTPWARHRAATRAS